MTERMEELLERYHELTIRETVEKVKFGLKCDPDTGDYKWARFQVKRLAAPLAGFLCNVAVLLLLVFAFTSEQKSVDTKTVVTLRDTPPEPDPPKPEPIDLKVETTESVETAVNAVSNIDQLSEPPPAPAPAPQLENPHKISSPVDVNTRMPSVIGVGTIGRSVGERGTLSEQFNAPPGADDAVLRALRWLKDHQLQDGSWDHGANSSSGMTGLALLCFLAHGETMQDEEFGGTVELAVKYLISQVKPDGNVANSGSHHAYGHAIATYALAEAYTMMPIVSLREPVERAAAVIVNGQQAGGGWDYNYSKGARVDTSVMGWQVQALKAVKTAGLYNDALEAALEKSVAAFVGHQNESGQFGYTSSSGHQMTGAAVLSLQMTGQAGTDPVTKGLYALRPRTFNWAAPDIKSPLYHWYYITQAKFQAGGADWDSWNPVFASELMNNQEADGHWELASDNKHGLVYSTTLCTLMLEVYYRYLPSNLIPAKDTVLAKVEPSSEIVPVILD